MRFVLIGGGNYGNIEEKPYNLREIDERIVSLANKKHPRLLYIGFNEKSNYMFSFIKQNFMDLGVQCEHLRYNDFENRKTVAGCFKRADIIYLGGGNTAEYMNQIRTFGLDEDIEKAINENKIFAGLSAGGMILSTNGMSDLGEVEVGNYTLVDGLNFVHCMFAPHFSSSDRRKSLGDFLRDRDEIVFGLDDQTAIVIDDDVYEIVKTNEKAKAYKCFYKSKEFYEIEMKQTGLVGDLLSK